MKLNHLANINNYAVQNHQNKLRERAILSDKFINVKIQSEVGPRGGSIDLLSHGQYQKSIIGQFAASKSFQNKFKKKRDNLASTIEQSFAAKSMSTFSHQ